MPTASLTEAVQQYYIVAPAVLRPERTLVLKHDETFGLFNEFGDIDTQARQDEGLYHEGTRFLSRYVLSLAGGRPLLLSAGVRRDNIVFGADLTNPDLYVDGRVGVERGSIHIFRTKLLWNGVCYERIHIRNFSSIRLQTTLQIEFSADYADIFQVRGQHRAACGQMLEPTLDTRGAELRYQGLDGVLRQTRIECTPEPAKVNDSEMCLDIDLAGHTEQIVSINIVCTGTVQPVRAISYEAARARAERARAERFASPIQTSNEQLNAWLARSAADLNMLLTNTTTGLYPYAGVPWFDTPFGRDGIITALEVLWFAPHVARGVLAFLADTQAVGSDADQDSEPGKILHEARRGEMAALKEIPFGRYYGSVDATPLFVMLAGAYFRRTGDRAFVETLWENILAALEWMDRYGDPDRDGFIEYARRSSTGLVQQGWKDSHDSVFHADGRLAEGPIALCEVQGYAYAARIAAAQLADALGHHERAGSLRAAAKTLRDRFQERFWCADIGLYALALDGEKRPCRVRSSNAGHCVYTGIAAADHASAILAALESDTFFSGWGVRTLADSEVRYNPMAYHNGSIWPHDNAIVAAAVTNSTSKHLAQRILAAQLDASTFFDSARLPELFCGFRRREGKAPTSYPVACSPQAWASGAVFMMIQACLGLSIDATQSRVVLRSPSLPACVDQIAIHGLSIGSAQMDIEVQRSGASCATTVARRSGSLDLVILA
ncbi:MAG: amylo-alpha-1,6-glucosidase [Sinobacteraceae bacterium]|nr:amylo-alpha-1,6-glucosidase [Nevskiaceae bacterium]